MRKVMAAALTGLALIGLAGTASAQAGQADYEPGVPAAAAGALSDEFGVNKGRFFVKPTSVTSYWALNSLPGQPLNVTKLRQAINWAIDRPAQVRVAGKFGGRRTSQILPPAMPGFIKANNIYAYGGANVAKAKSVAGDVGNVPRKRSMTSSRLTSSCRACSRPISEANASAAMADQLKSPPRHRILRRSSQGNEMVVRAAPRRFRLRIRQTSCVR